MLVEDSVVLGYDNSALGEFAASQQRLFDAVTCPKDRKLRGHFGTPVKVAEFMAGMFAAIPNGLVRVLDAGAGVGTLSAALCQRLLLQQESANLEFELWENDPRLVPFLKRTMETCQNALRDNGHCMEFTIHQEDFILSNARKPLFDSNSLPPFQLAVLNPPYYKLRKDSVHARAMSHIVHGQPNIYALFMAAAAERLAPGGELVAITPRSYFNGQYFKRFRKWFFDRMTARQIHIFVSRTDTFQEDEVLQESVILAAKRQLNGEEVLITSSHGRDFESIQHCTLAYENVFEQLSGNQVIRITTDRIDRQIVSVMDRLTDQFRTLGYGISTGPVVSFRCGQFLRTQRAEGTAPLLWMHNVRPFVTQFPSKNGKPTHIMISEDSKRLLVPAERYVLLKRFSAKEEKRRLVAGIVDPTDSYSPWLGIENHLNYIYGKDSQLTRPEAIGLAAFFNSILVDRYFRTISGNTQVNATEVRAMPMPSREKLLKMGAELGNVNDRSTQTIERIVGGALDLSDSLLDELIESAK